MFDELEKEAKEFAEKTFLKLREKIEICYEEFRQKVAVNIEAEKGGK